MFLVHVYLHPTIYTVLRGISIPTLTCPEFVPLPRVAFTLVLGGFSLKDWVPFQNVHRFTLNLQGSNFTYWGAVVFEK